MRSAVFAFAATILLVTNASPTPEDGGAVTLTRRDAINDCGDSSFINQGSDASPLVADCQKIASNIAGGGSWTIPCAGNAHRTYAKYGTCAVGAQCTIQGAQIAHIGNQDTIDIINASIEKFATGDKIGAKGLMPCQNSFNEDNYVEWGIYHT